MGGGDIRLLDFYNLHVKNPRDRLFYRLRKLIKSSMLQDDHGYCTVNAKFLRLSESDNMIDICKEFADREGLTLYYDDSEAVTFVWIPIDPMKYCMFQNKKRYTYGILKNS